MAKITGGTFNPTVIEFTRAEVVDDDHVADFTANAVVYTSISMARQVTLPAADAANKGKTILVSDESGSVSGVNTVTVIVDGPGTIEGAASYVLDAAYGGAAFTSTGIEYIISSVDDDVAAATAGGVAGGGTLNYVPLWTPDGATLGNSAIQYDSGTGTTTIGGSYLTTGTVQVLSDWLFDSGGHHKVQVVETTSAVGKKLSLFAGNSSHATGEGGSLYVLPGSCTNLYGGSLYLEGGVGSTVANSGTVHVGVDDGGGQTSGVVIGNTGFASGTGVKVQSGAAGITLLASGGVRVTGTATTGIDLSGTSTTGLAISASATGIALSGYTTGISLTSSGTTGINISPASGTLTTGIVIDGAGAITTGINITKGSTRLNLGTLSSGLKGIEVTTSSTADIIFNNAGTGHTALFQTAMAAGTTAYGFTFKTSNTLTSATTRGVATFLNNATTLLSLRADTSLLVASGSTITNGAVSLGWAGGDTTGISSSSNFVLGLVGGATPLLVQGSSGTSTLQGRPVTFRAGNAGDSDGLDGPTAAGVTILTSGLGGSGAASAAAGTASGTTTVTTATGGAGGGSGNPGNSGTLNLNTGNSGTGGSGNSTAGTIVIAPGTSQGTGNGANVSVDAGTPGASGTAGSINIGVTRGIINIGAAASSIGLYGATATPQFNSEGETAGFTAGVGTAVLSDSTFTGNTGTRAYTIGDIVKALKLIGILDTSD